MNNFVGIGNLTRDPEMRYTESGKAYTKFTLAISASRKEGQTLFLDCTAWEKLAETAAEYLRKGHKACVLGEIRMDKYTDRDGASRVKWYCHARNIEFLTPRAESSEPMTTFDEPIPDEDQLPF